MEKEFVTYEQALALHELGFDWDTYEHYDSHTKEICDIMKDIPAPLKQQVFRWFREKYELESCIIYRRSMENNKEYYDWLIKGQEVVYRHFTTYEEAENACINELIKLIKNK